MSEQKKAEEFGITEDDVSEIRQVELETKVKRGFAKISQSRRRPPLAATSAFTFKTLLRHYAKQTLTPQKVDLKLQRRHN